MNKELNNKVKRLETIEKVLTICTIVVGIITVIDIFIPDPIFLLDEAALASITGLCQLIAGLVRNKRDELLSEGKTKINYKEIEEVNSKVVETAKVVKNSRKKK